MKAFNLTYQIISGCIEVHASISGTMAESRLQATYSIRKPQGIQALSLISGLTEFVRVKYIPL